MTETGDEQRSAREDASYGELVGKLSQTLPRLADRLGRAERLRIRRLAFLMEGGVRLSGLEEWLERMHQVADAWEVEPRIAALAPLVHRGIGDYEAAIESSLSGYPAVALDAMRDVMETELLLLDFYLDTARVTEWLQADRRTRLRRFGPGAEQ